MNNNKINPKMLIPIELNQHQMKQVTVEFLRDYYIKLEHTIPSYNQTEEYVEFLKAIRTTLKDLTTEHEWREIQDEI